MEIQQLRYFLAAANCSNFSRAAKQCFTSRQNIAHAMNVLERELGITLFERKGNGVELTPAGRTVGYWITPRTPDELEHSAPVFIPENDCIFYRASTRPGQVREMPAAAAAMARLRDVEGYIEAQSVTERVAACFAAFMLHQALAHG